MKVKITLAWKIIAGFGLITLCIGVAGLLGVESMDRVTAKLSKISDEDNRAIALLSNARIEASYHSRAIYRYLLVGDDEKNQAVNTLHFRMKNVNQQMQLYETTVLSNDESLIYKKYLIDWDAYLESADRMMQVEGRTLDKVHNGDFINKISRVEDDLARLIQLNEQYVEIDKTEGKKTIEENRNKLFLVLIVSKILSITFAFWFGARITRPLKRLAKTTRQAIEGNFEVEIPRFKRFGDEISDLSNELHELIHVYRQKSK